MLGLITAQVGGGLEKLPGPNINKSIPLTLVKYIWIIVLAFTNKHLNKSN